MDNIIYLFFTLIIFPQKWLAREYIQNIFLRQYHIDFHNTNGQVQKKKKKKNCTNFVFSGIFKSCICDQNVVSLNPSSVVCLEVIISCL